MILFTFYFLQKFSNHYYLSDYYLTFSILVVSLRTSRFNIQKFYMVLAFR